MRSTCKSALCKRVITEIFIAVLMVVADLVVGSIV